MYSSATRTNSSAYSISSTSPCSNGTATPRVRTAESSSPASGVSRRATQTWCSGSEIMTDSRIVVPSASKAAQRARGPGQNLINAARDLPLGTGAGGQARSRRGGNVGVLPAVKVPPVQRAPTGEAGGHALPSVFQTLAQHGLNTRPRFLRISSTGDQRNWSATIPNADGNKPPPPTACRARNAISAPTDGAIPHSSDPSVKMARQPRNTCRRPKLSESLPATGSMTIWTSR